MLTNIPLHTQTHFSRTDRQTRDIFVGIVRYARAYLSGSFDMLEHISQLKNILGPQQI